MMPDFGRIAAALRLLADALEAGIDGGVGGKRGSGEEGRCTRDTVHPGTGMLSAEEFGRRFNRSASWAKDLCRRGVLPGAFTLPNRAWRIPEEAVAAYIASLKKPADVVPLLARRTGSISDWRKLRLKGRAA